MSGFFPKLTRREAYTGTTGLYGYRRYRAEVAEDCLYRCVYCDCPQDAIGGEAIMELDHFRPESIFENLKEEPTNLLYACRSCNGKKRHDWPAGNSKESHINAEGYLDPFTDERAVYFTVEESGQILALAPPACYIIKRLALDRPLLRRIRRIAILKAKLEPKLQRSIVTLQKHVNESPPEVATKLNEVLEVLKIQLELL